MEGTPLTSITLETIKRVYRSNEFRDYDRLGLVLQAYLRRTEHDLQEVLELARRRGAPLAVRLVKARIGTPRRYKPARPLADSRVQDKVATDVKFREAHADTTRQP